jgi:hypothetical protein
MILVLSEQATPQQVQAMWQAYSNMIKIVVDIRQGILAGGGGMHSDCEEILINQGSLQADLWGANWFPVEQSIDFESLINIRPSAGNRSMFIQDQAICDQVEAVTRRILGGVI